MKRALIALVLIAVVVGASAGIYAVNTSGEQEPPGLAHATPTPDTTSAKDATGARLELAASDPRLGKLVDAVRLGAVDDVLALIDWQQAACGGRRDVACGAAKDGETIKVVNAGWPVTFFVPPDVLRPSLEQALAGEPLALRYAAQSTDQPSVYYLGFDGAAVKGKGLAPLADPGSNVTGLFVTVDTSRAAPIVLIETGISDSYPATKRGSEPGFEKQRIIAFDGTTAAAR